MTQPIPPGSPSAPTERRGAFATFLSIVEKLGNLLQGFCNTILVLPPNRVKFVEGAFKPGLVIPARPVKKG